MFLNLDTAGRHTYHTERLLEKWSFPGTFMKATSLLYESNSGKSMGNWCCQEASVVCLVPEDLVDARADSDEGAGVNG